MHTDNGSGPFHVPGPGAPDPLRILCLGDVVGRPGRALFKRDLPRVRQALGADLVIANGENAAGGIGLTAETLRELLSSGVDVVTSGNHIWKHRDIYPLLDKNQRVLRPLNYGTSAPGRGWLVFSLPCGARVAVINLLGRVFMDPADCPFAAVDRALEQIGASMVPGTPDITDSGDVPDTIDSGDAPDIANAPDTAVSADVPHFSDPAEFPNIPIIIVDFHAEASSEKRAMAHHLDGKVSAVLGTHTHVQTADALISPLGTASLTDLGMCGVEEESVLGMDKAKVLKRFTTGLPFPLVPARGRAVFNGALIEVDKTSGKSLSIRLVRGNPSS